MSTSDSMDRHIRHISPENYYNAHCSGCGERTSADRLAFDFGQLINKAILKESQRQYGKTEDWIDLVKIDLRLYYVQRDLEQGFGLPSGKFGTFQFKVSDLKRQIAKLAGCKVQDLENMQDQQNRFFNKLVKKVLIPVDTIDSRAQRQPADPEDVWRVITMVQNAHGEEDVIAEFQVKVILACDDNGLPFAKGLLVQYEDDERESVIRNVCPNCGKSFYSEVGKHQEYVICMAGSARVGKTAYLASLVDCIQRRGGDFLTVVPSNDPDWDFFENQILRKFQQGEKIDKTAFIGNGETIPLFSLEIEVHRGRGDKKSYIFTFIDMPGEAFDPTDGMRADEGVNFIINKRRIVQYVSIFWFCIDPTQIDGNLDRAMGISAMEEDKIDTNTRRVMNNIENTLSAVAATRADENSDGRSDAAVLITKSDEIFEDDNLKLFRPDTDVVKTYIREGEFDYEGDNVLDYGKCREFVINSYQYLKKAKNIESMLAKMFAHYAPFAVAAYGKNIIEDEDLASVQQPVQPSMVELPFLWSLSVMGILPSTYKTTRMKTVGRFLKKKIPEPCELKARKSQLFDKGEDW